MRQPGLHETLKPPQLYEDVLYSMYTLIDLNRLGDLQSLGDARDVIRDPNFYDEQGVTTTPLIPRFSRWEHLDQYTKLETDQAIGAFKARGAQAGGETLLHNYPSTRYVCAYSAGNHGLGVALFVKTWNQRLINQGYVGIDGDGRVLDADRHKLLEAHIFVAAGASEDKVTLLRQFQAYGTVLHIGGKSLAEASERCDKFICDENGKVPDTQPVAQLLHPYRSPDVMAGQSTALLESIFQLRDRGVDLTEKPLLWYVGYGGGGLANGSAVLMDILVRLSTVHPGSKVIAAQMEGCDSTIRALERLDSGVTDLRDLFINPTTRADDFDPSADGTAVRDPDPDNLELTQYLRRLGVLEMRRVGKTSVAKAMRLENPKREPAGALGDAAAQEDQDARGTHWIAGGGEAQADEQATVVTVASGGNRSERTVDHFEATLKRPARRQVATVLGGSTIRLAPERPQPRAARTARHAGSNALRRRY